MDSEWQFASFILASPPHYSDTGFHHHPDNNTHDSPDYGDRTGAGPSSRDTSGYGTGSDDTSFPYPDILDTAFTTTVEEPVIDSKEKRVR